MKSRFAMAGLALLAACSGGPATGVPAPGQPMQSGARDSIPATIAREGARTERPSDTLRRAPGSDSFSTKGLFSGSRRDSLFYFEVASPSQLEARIDPENPKLNIRFNQLLMPGGEADGPFSHTLSYSLKKKGWYALRIGPDRMAEGDTTGRFRLTVHLR